MESHPLIRWFAYSHLPEGLQRVSEPFSTLAVEMINRCGRGPQLDVAMQRLLEAKDAAVRAAIENGIG